MVVTMLQSSLPCVLRPQNITNYLDMNMMKWIENLAPKDGSYISIKPGTRSKIFQNWKQSARIMYLAWR